MSELQTALVRGFVSEIDKVAKKEKKRSIAGSVGRGAAVGAALGAYPAVKVGKAASRAHRRVTSKYLARKGVQEVLSRFREVPLPPTARAARFLFRGPRRLGMAVGALPMGAAMAIGGGVGALSHIIKRVKAFKAKRKARK